MLLLLLFWFMFYGVDLIVGCMYMYSFVIGFLLCVENKDN